MNYEQKYKEALERARTSFSYPDYPGFMRVDVIFPELKKKESEDERIKREIVAYINELADLKNEKIPTKWLAWLEKQGEKKPTDKVEPKFKVGDWVLNNVCFPMQIASIKDGMYIFTEGDAISVSFIDENFHLWTIEDAKDGDVLVDEDNNIGIYVGEKDDFWHSCIYLGCDSCLREIGGYHKHNNTKPATKEQRDLLFKEIHDAEYEWDANKKELKKIESKTLDADEVIEWLKKTIRAHSENYGVYKATRLTLPYNSIEDLINDFKEDFGL